MYVYICLSLSIYKYIYIYIYICIHRKVTTGVSTNGVTANCVSFDRGAFGVLPLTYFYRPKSARGVPVSAICQIHYF